MGPKALFSSILSLCFLVTLASASTFLSDNIFNQAEVLGSRVRVNDAALKACPVDFKKLNYTNLTAQCKGPEFSPEDCCKAFKQFACPYANYINDLTTDCLNNMAYYINLNVHYPVGLFYNKCIQGSKGLECGKQ
ncbi:unnamed protein product [Lupinus luteus]|uniref:GPI-anchored protein LLG1-like domain-containing protein n=1 Tax=Lupinus luteus TaxID=3873 RepID=A0AAV1W4D4_LUPLU